MPFLRINSLRLSSKNNLYPELASELWQASIESELWQAPVHTPNFEK
jgi:hypothetical protein